MIEGAELINLIFSVIILGVFWILFRRSGNRQFMFIDIALIFLLFSGFSTVAEGFFLFGLFNFLEHLFYFFSLVFITIAVVRTGKSYL